MLRHIVANNRAGGWRAIKAAAASRTGFPGLITAGLNPWAVAVATAVFFAFSSGWYAGLGSRLARLSDAQAQDRRSAGRGGGGRSFPGLLLTAGVAMLVRWTGVDGVLPAPRAGCGAGDGLPLVLRWGSVTSASRRPRAHIHGGDWVVKLIIVGLIVGLWR